MTELQRMKADLENNPELQQKFEEAKKEAAEGGAKSDGEVLVNAAKAMGYTITLSEFEKELAESQTLSEEELDRVSGGAEVYGEDEHGHDNWCYFVWHCHMVTCHTASDSTQVACFGSFKH